MYHCDPPGRIDPESLRHYGTNPPRKNVMFFDQEPCVPDLTHDLFEELAKRNRSSTHKALIVSETNSDNVDYTCTRWQMRPFYYFFHGWAALDWYRGYDRSFLIQPWQQRQISKTFFSPNRIIGGLRQHRVLMLYWFKKLDTMNNWISASLVCPVEQQHIMDIAKQYQHALPDIQSVLSSIELPLLFPNEDSPRMSSCWLDQFDLCSQSLIYHVSETVYTGRRLHLTEKSFKPIALGMPFVFTAPAGSVEYLRQYGFKTFDSVWSEDYDLESNDLLRAQKVALTLKQINDLSPQQKQELFEQCWPIIEHNWNWFYHGGFESVLWQELSQMLDQLRHYLS